jgi:hypothetical protein
VEIGRLPIVVVVFWGWLGELVQLHANADQGAWWLQLSTQRSQLHKPRLLLNVFYTAAFQLASTRSQLRGMSVVTLWIVACIDQH